MRCKLFANTALYADKCFSVCVISQRQAYGAGDVISRLLQILQSSAVHMDGHFSEYGWLMACGECGVARSAAK